MAVLRIVSAVATDTGNALSSRNLAQQRGQGRCVTDTVVGNVHGPDLERGRINPVMDLASLAAVIRAVLLRLPFAMIGLSAGTRIWLAANVADIRSRFNGLATKVETALREDPYSGRVFVLRGRPSDLVKVLWWTGDGLCLLCKRLERGRFKLLQF